MSHTHSKETLLACIAAISLTLNAQAKPPDDTLVTFIDTSPATLNPRATMDAIGQRIDMFLFRALTRVDADLKTRGDLASSWKAVDGGRAWRFEIAAGLSDHRGQPITASDIRACLDEYIHGTPVSPLKGSFPTWKETAVIGNSLEVRLTSPDPFLPRNLSLLRFFRIENESKPCRDPKRGETVIGTGPYRMDPFTLNPESRIALVPQDASRPRLVFEIVRDETSRLLKFLKGDADFLQNSFSPTKTDWLMKHHGDRFKLADRGGVNVSYLAFNLRDPVLSKLEVRRAIAYAIDRDAIIRSKLRGFANPAGSFLAPELPEAKQTEFRFDLAEANRLLDQAGFPRGADGVRFRLKYKTTPAKDGFEVAQILQDMLKKAGIAVDLEMVESAVFFASIRKGAFQLYSSRWIGISDGSIYQRTMKSDHADNRVKYKNEEVDRWIDSTLSEMDEPKRAAFLAKIQDRMGQDLPYLPLWFWTNSLISRKEIVGLEAKDLSLSGSFVPFSKLTKTETP